MLDIPAYERDGYLEELDTDVTTVGDDRGRPFAVLADTVLFPEAGGQPADHGWIDATAVTDVRNVGGEIRHYLAAPLAPGPGHLRLDWERRFNHMQQHTAQHLISAIAEDRFGWTTTAFHLGEELCDVELDVPSVPAHGLAALETAVAAEVRAARPVRSRRVSPAVFGTLPVRTRGLPEGFAGDVRLVEIEGIDLNTCGGTHLRSTAEIETVKLLGTEPMRGGTRVHFVAGGRVRARLGAHEARNATLRTLLGVPDTDIGTAVAARLEQVRTLDKRVHLLEEELASALADALAARGGRLVEAHIEGRDAAFLQRLGRALAQRAPACSALLTAGDERGGFFLLIAGEGADLDVTEVGRKVAALFDGRGGGSGRTFQGKAGSLASRSEACALLRAALGG